MQNILCLGAATWDIIFRIESFPDHPTKVLAEDCVETCAGMASAAAMAIAALGGRAAVRARLGQDHQGERWLAGMTAAGVDVSRVERIEGARSGISTIVVDQCGERLIVPHYDPRLRTGIPDIEAASLDTFDCFLVDTRWPEAAAQTLDYARNHDRPALLDADIAPVAVLQALVPLASHVVFSSEALYLLCGEGPTARNLRKAQDMTKAIIGVTQGAKGCSLLLENQLVEVPAPAVHVIDTLAAGDVFHGAYLLKLSEGATPVQAARFANAAASLKCTRFGGIAGRPSRAEVDRFLASGVPPE